MKLGDLGSYYDTPHAPKYMEPDVSFSSRENDVINELLEGKSNKQIALSLGISERTVEFHLTNLFEKMHVGSRVELILKLGKSTGEVYAIPVESTVEEEYQNMDNGKRTDSEFSTDEFNGKESVGKKEFAMDIKYLPYLPPLVILMGIGLAVGGFITEKYGAVVVGFICAGAAAYHWITHTNSQSKK